MAARQHLSPWAVTGWVISAVGLVAAVLSVLVPTLREWLADHGLLGWLVTAAVIICAPAVCALAIRERFKQASLRADIALVRDRLDGWTLDSEFYAYMSHRVHWKAFPATYRRSILDHLDRWERDTRAIGDPDLARAFGAVRECVRKLDTHIGTHLSGDPTRDYEYLTVSLDEPWKQNAYDDLIPSANHLTDALSDLYALLHRLEVRAQA